MQSPVDYEALASGFLRALRGQVSQLALSQQLGYSSNVISKWESGKRFPTAHESLRAAQAVGIDVTTALARFDLLTFGTFPNFDRENFSYVPTLLRRMQGHKTLAELVTASGRNRFAVSRFMLGESEPRLPDFLRLIAATSGRLFDWMAVFVDPEQIAAARPHWRQLETLRSLAYKKPWSEAIRVALELESYRRLPKHQAGWLAAQLGISQATEDDTVQAMDDAGAIRWDGTHWEVDPEQSVDTSRDRRQAYELKRFWSKTAEQRMLHESDGLFSYLVFTASQKDMARLRELHRKYYLQLRAISTASLPAECVAVANVQLFRLDEVIESAGDE